MMESLSNGDGSEPAASGTLPVRSYTSILHLDRMTGVKYNTLANPYKCVGGVDRLLDREGSPSELPFGARTGLRF
jgi:hypothetical protein